MLDETTIQMFGGRGFEFDVEEGKMVLCRFFLKQKKNRKRRNCNVLAREVLRSWLCQSLQSFSS